MSNLSFIPPATASKPAQDVQPPLFSEKKEYGASSFEQFLESASKDQFKAEPSREKPERSRPAENNAKPEPKRDEFKTADRPYSDKLESRSKADQEAAADGGAKEVSRPQAENTGQEKVAVEAEGDQDQKGETLVDGNQYHLSALLAHLAGTEAVIRGETQPETVQMAELAEATADPELVEAIQETGVAIESGEVKLTEMGSEIPIVNAMDRKQVSPDSGLNTENVKVNTEAPNGNKTVDLGDLSQIIPQASGNNSRSEGESLSKGGQNDGKGQVFEPVKVFQNIKVDAESENQAVNKLNFAEDTLAKKIETSAQLLGNRVLARYDQSSAKTGKVNLAVIQTQLAVNEAPKVKSETPVLNVVASQPSFGNATQIQTSGSEGVNSINREELFSQIVEHAKVVVNNGGGEMEISLKPEHLGKLQLKVTVENEVVTAKFIAESQQVKEIIESNLGQLKQNLRENGIQVDSIMVSVGNYQGGENFGQAAYNRERFNNFEGVAGAINDDSVLETGEPAPMARRDTLIDLIA